MRKFFAPGGYGDWVVPLSAGLLAVILAQICIYWAKP